MRPLFTIHAGEFVVGDHIERKFRRVNLWMPSRDTGTDLLVTDSKNEKTVSLQVKFSRDFLATHMSSIFQKPLRACGWWSLNREKNFKIKSRLLGVCVGWLRAPEYGFRNYQAVRTAQPARCNSQERENNSELSLGNREESLLGISRLEASRTTSNCSRPVLKQ